MSDRFSLKDFRIDTAEISGLGPKTRSTLREYGFETAADFIGGGIAQVFNGYGHVDVAYLTCPDGRDITIDGLGPARVSALVEWRQAVGGALEPRRPWTRETDDEAAKWTERMLALNGNHTFAGPQEAREYFRHVVRLRREGTQLRQILRSELAAFKRTYPHWQSDAELSDLAECAKQSITAFECTVAVIGVQIDALIDDLRRLIAAAESEDEA